MSSQILEAKNLDDEKTLRKTARPLTAEEILNDAIQTLIVEMKNIMSNAPGVGLAAPQIGRSIQIAVIEDAEERLINGIREAYATYSNNKSVSPQRTTSQINETSVVVNMPGYLPNTTLFTVKVNVKVPSNVSRSLPFLTGTILLIDQTNGQLLSLMDSALITAMRTGAAGAVGVECLANPDAKRLAVIGAGVQAEWQIKALHAIGRVSQIYIYDLVLLQSKKLSEKISRELNIPTFIAATVKEAITHSDIVILTTQSKTPVITSDMLFLALKLVMFLRIKTPAENPPNKLQFLEM
jgi:ornithine cyclodeaminase/alanine dehydrogenase-like protein (mu-crystallin family)